jgi:hypothetical protein
VINSLVLASLGSLVACSRGASVPVGTVNMSLEDGRISAAVRTALLNERDLGVREIAVESHGGVVTLSGTVRSAEEARRAEALAREVNGVREVKSALRVEPDSVVSVQAFYWPPSPSTRGDRPKEPIPRRPIRSRAGCPRPRCQAA